MPDVQVDRRRRKRSDVRLVSSSQSYSAPRLAKFWSSFPSWDGDNISRTPMVSSSSPPPTQQRSKFERYWQWPGKRLSRLMTTSPLSPAVSPSKTSFRSSPIPTSPCTPHKAVCPTSPASILFQDNQSTLDLLPHLSMEDLGKVNARYAPLPSTLRVSSGPHQAVLSKSPAEPPLPRLPSSIPPLSTLPLPAAVLPTHSHPRLVNRRGIPIALPLSPVDSLVDGGGAEFSSTAEQAGVMYLTVEDRLDEESGEASLCLVEIPE